MKEIIVIEEDFWVKHFQEREKDFYEEDMCSGGNPEEWWHYEKEQVPETFEELKELCKSIKGNKKDCGGAMWFEFGCLNNDKMYLGKFLCVDEKGQVGIAERSWGGDISITIFAQNRTPQQMWQIIKNLIGEE